MRTNRTWPHLAAIILMFAFAQCKKEKQLTELEKLPPATQTGAYTFGCLVNGKAWVAGTDCKYLCDPKIKVKIYYDFGGTINITAIQQRADNIDERIIISFDSADYKLIHNYSGPLHTTYSFRDYINRDCRNIYSADQTTTFANGQVNITRYDPVLRIIAGSFYFKLKENQCDTLKISDGRFDIQF